MSKRHRFETSPRVNSRIPHPDLPPNEQRARLRTKQLNDPFGNSNLLIPVEEMEERACVDNVNLAGKLLHKLGTVIEDIRNDELGFELGPISKELVSNVGEVGSKI